MVSKLMFLGYFFEAHYQRAKPRLDCAGCSETWVGPSIKSSEIEEKAEVFLMLFYFSLFRRNVLEKILQTNSFGHLCASFCRSGGPLGAQRVPKVVTKVDQMKLWNRPWQPGRPECYPNAARGRLGFENGAHGVSNSVILDESKGFWGLIYGHARIIYFVYLFWSCWVGWVTKRSIYTSKYRERHMSHRSIQYNTNIERDTCV